MPPFLFFLSAKIFPFAYCLNSIICLHFKIKRRCWISAFIPSIEKILYYKKIIMSKYNSAL